MRSSLCDYQPPLDLLRGRVILVTGAAEGIGRAVTRGLAQHSATVIMLDRQRRKLELLFDEIGAQSWAEPVIAVHDLAAATEETCQQIALGIAHDFGRLDGVLHNAAVINALTPLHHYPYSEWNAIVKVNLEVPFLLTRALFPLLLESDSASVVFTTADVGREGRAYWGAYAVAYSGVERLVQVWSEETRVNTSLRFNSFDPGVVRTKMRARLYPGELPESRPDADTIVPAYLFLLGKDSAGLRGKALSATTPLPKQL